MNNLCEKESWHFCLEKKLSQADCSKIQAAIQQKLSKLLKVPCDDVLAEYVVVMVGNRKSMKEISESLFELVGPDIAEEFALWLGQTLFALTVSNESGESETKTPGPGKKEMKRHREKEKKGKKNRREKKVKKEYYHVKVEEEEEELSQIPVVYEGPETPPLLPAPTKHLRQRNMLLEAAKESALSIQNTTSVQRRTTMQDNENTNRDGRMIEIRKKSYKSSPVLKKGKAFTSALERQVLCYPNQSADKAEGKITRPEDSGTKVITKIRYIPTSFAPDLLPHYPGMLPPPPFVWPPYAPYFRTRGRGRGRGRNQTWFRDEVRHNTRCNAFTELALQSYSESIISSQERKCQINEGDVKSVHKKWVRPPTLDSSLTSSR